jgi:hypothetical protein
MFLACKKAARVLVLGIALLGAALGAHTMTEAAQGPGSAGAAAVAAAPEVATVAPGLAALAAAHGRAQEGAALAALGVMAGG